MGIFARMEKRFLRRLLLRLYLQFEKFTTFGDDNQKCRLYTCAIFSNVEELKIMLHPMKKKISGHLHILGKIYENYSIEKFTKYPKSIARYVTVGE